MRSRGGLGWVLVGAVAACLAGPAAAQASWTPAVELGQPANAGVPTAGEGFGVSCAAAGSCLAVGGFADAQGLGFREFSVPFAAAQAGGTFGATAAVPLPAGADHDSVNAPDAAQLNGVSCAGTTCVAVGVYTDTGGNQDAVVATQSSGSWSAVQIPAPAAGDSDVVLDGVSCPVAGSCVAVGSVDDANGHSQPLVVSEGSGGTWGPAVVVTLPANAGTNPAAYLAGVSCASAGQCSAVGDYQDSSAVSHAFAVGASSGTFGTTGVEVAPPSDATAGDVLLNGVSCPASGSCTAVGSYTVSAAAKPWAATGSSGSFSGAVPVPLPATAVTAGSPATLDGVSCTAADACVAVGSYTDASSDQQALTAIEASGTWAPSASVALAAPAGADPDPEASLLSLSCASATDCTAVGGYLAGGNPQIMQATFTGSSWGAATELAPPNGANALSASETDVACPSDGNCAAVGFYALGAFAMADVFSNGAWAAPSEVNPPTGGASPSLEGIACPTSTATCAAVGHYTGDPTTANPTEQALAAASSGGSWTAATVPAPLDADTNPLADLFDVSCIASGECTAVGTYDDSAGHQQPMAASGSGTTWAVAQKVSAPASSTSQPGAALFGVSCPTAASCTAVGTYNDPGGNEQAMLATEASGTWGTATEVAPPSDVDSTHGASLDAIACTAPGSCTAVGEYQVPGGNDAPMAVTETGGTWGAATRLPLPTGAQGVVELGSVSCAAAGDCAASGQYLDASGNQQALTLTQTSGTWGSPTEITPPSGAGTPGALTRLDGVSCTADGSCTAVGTYTDTLGNQRPMATTGTIPVPAPPSGGGTTTTTTGSSTTPPPLGGTPPPSGHGLPNPVVLSTPAIVEDVGVSGNLANVDVGCPAKATGCTITITITTVETLKGGKVTAFAAKKKARITHKTVVLGTKTVTLAPGQGEIVHVALGRAAQKLLKAHHRLPARVTVTQQGRTLHSATVTFKAKASKKKK